MLRFILRRVLQMIPTVFGVILVTFILFNVVGGSPAAMTLGKHVSARMLEEFDEQRGFNKPLIFGSWTRTRAYTDTHFRRNAEDWAAVENVDYRPPEGRLPGRIVLRADDEYLLPTGFPLDPNIEYRMVVTYRTADDAEVTLLSREPRAPEPPENAEEDGEAPTDTEEIADKPERQLFGSMRLMPTRAWRKVTFPVRSLDGLPIEVVFRVENTDLEIDSIVFRRKVANPFDSQLFFYLRQIARFDFGISSSTNQPVSKLLRDGIIPSLTLTIPIFFVELIVTLSLSLLCAFFRNRFIDRFFVVISVALMSVNYLVFIVGGQYFLGYRLGLFPVWGYESARYLLLPVLIGATSGLGSGIRFYRTIMLDEMYKEYVRTALAKGVSNRGVLLKHVLKNAMIPIVTNVVIAIPFLYTGSLLLETFFGIPGLGYLGVNAIFSSDVDLLRALVFIGAVIFVIANLLTDICYAWVDPRVKLS